MKPIFSASELGRPGGVHNLTHPLEEGEKEKDRTQPIETNRKDKGSPALVSAETHAPGLPKAKEAKNPRPWNSWIGYDEGKFTMTAWQLAAILYLITPIIIFLIYLHSPAAAVGAIGLLIAIHRLCKAKKTPSKMTKNSIILSLAFAILVAFLCGNMIWLYGTERFDWGKHNAILSDLMSRPWPVFYDTQESLNYYLAFYLPAAVVGKFTASFYNAKVALSLWTITGLFLGFVNLLGYVNLEKQKLRGIFLALFLFSTYSGWDWLAHIITNGKLPPFPSHLEWGSGLTIQYSSFTTAVAYVPQHFIPSIIGTIMILSFPSTAILFLIPVLTIWSTLAGIGVAYVYCVSVAFESMRERKVLARLGDVVAASLISVPILLFLAMHNKVDMSPIISPLPFNYLTFILTDLGPFLLAAFIVSRRVNREKPLMLLSLVFLIILPTFKFGGGFNDVVMRTSMPPLIAVICIIIKHMFRLKSRLLSALVVLLLLCGIVTPINEIFRMGYVKVTLTQPTTGVNIGDPLWKSQYLGITRFNDTAVDFLTEPILGRWEK